MYPLILRFSKCYFRYIDDIFSIWNGTKEELEVFLQKINNCHPTIKSEYQISKTEINFLGKSFQSCNQLRIKLYMKPTNKQSYHHNKSELPFHEEKYCI